MSGNSGGKAVAGGIGYQQRVGGFFLAFAAMKIGPDEILEFPCKGTLRSLRFETSDSIDDLCLVTEMGVVCYCQIKRSLVLSESSTSEFGNVINQCIRQFSLNSATNSELYLLIVSSAASRQIVTSLQRVCTAVRESPTEYTRVPFNQDEQRALATLKQLFSDHYTACAGDSFSEEVFSAFCQKLFVLKLDIESQGPLENSLLALMLSRLSNDHREPGHAWSIWHKCVFLAAEYFAKRGVLTDAAIQNRFQSEFDEKPSGDNIHWDSQPIQSGLEVLLMDSFIEGFDLIAAELTRFADDGSRQLRFADGKVQLAPDKPWARLIFRSATWEAQIRFLRDHPEMFSGKSVGQIESAARGDPNIMAHALAHGEQLTRMLKERNGLTQCIHCGRSVNRSDALLIEIDEERLPRAIGASHSACMRPTDRVFGKITIDGISVPNLLCEFDLSGWAKAVVIGQRGLQDALKFANQSSRVVNVLWTPEEVTTSFGTWCLRITLADGSETYVKSRGRVERMGKDEADTKVTFMRNAMREVADSNPWCYSQDGTFGDRQSLRSRVSSEELITCEKIEVIRYSTIFEERAGDWYAPLCFITERTSDRICTFGEEAIPLFSNPLEIADFIKRWAAVGVDVGEIAVHPLMTDDQFDLQCRQWFEERMYIVVDPELSNDGRLRQGVAIMDKALAKLVLCPPVAEPDSEQESHEPRTPHA